MKYWPGTNIPKSQNNAFTESKKDSLSFMLRDKFFKQSLIGSQNATKSHKNNIIYKKQSDS